MHLLHSPNICWKESGRMDLLLVNALHLILKVLDQCRLFSGGTISRAFLGKLLFEIVIAFFLAVALVGSGKQIFKI